jgi:hypothetical protein
VMPDPTFPIGDADLINSMAGKCVAQASAEPQSCPPPPVLLHDPDLVPARADSVHNRDRRVGYALTAIC